MHLSSRVAVVLGLGLSLGLTARADAPAPAVPHVPAAARPTMLVARGSFDVTLTPRPFDEQTQGAALARMAIAKTLRGDLAGTSHGVMLSAMGDVKGSAGYVAIEQVTATLAGRSGSFVLQHSGTLTRGAPELVVRVVPDSGTGQLAGLTGQMSIDVADDGKHSYVFEYALPAAP